MRLAAIIAEYNPFHLGHARQIVSVRGRLGSDIAIVVVLSGHWTQRGEPSLQAKWDRAEAAIAGGADLVLELPSIFSCAPAPIFANGAIKLLLGTGLHLTLCFGCETPDYRCLHAVADLLLHEEKWAPTLQRGLRAGLGFPRARAEALTEVLSQNPIDPPRFYLPTGFLEDTLLKADATTSSAAQAGFTPATGTNSPAASAEAWLKLLRQPNALLGIEYLRACKQNDSNHQIQFLTLPRWGAAEQETDSSFPAFSEETCGSDHQLKACYYPSASQIRAQLLGEANPRHWMELLARGVPPHSGALLFRDKQAHNLFDPDSLWPSLFAALAGRIPEELQLLEGWSEDQAQRVHHLVQEKVSALSSYHTFLQALSHRGLTQARIRRSLYSALFGLTQERARLIRGAGPSYLRPLAYSRRGKYVLKLLRENATLPSLSQPSDLRNWDENHPVALQGNWETKLGLHRALTLGQDPLLEYQQHTRLIRL